MKVNVNSVHFKADKKLEDFIVDKVGKLNQYYEGVISGDVTMKLDSNEKIKDKIIEVRLVIKGNDLFAKKSSKSFEDAADQAVEALRKQINKYKDKLKGL